MKPTTSKHLDFLINRLPELESVQLDIQRAAETLIKCGQHGRKIMVCGNGGSAADSEHIAGEMMKSFILPRNLKDDEIAKLKSSGIDDWEELAQSLQRGIPTIALTGHISLATAIANDTNPYITFAQQVYVIGKEGDVLIALSTSGSAKNVLYAVKAAKAFGMHTIGFTGSCLSPMDSLCDIMIKVPETETYRVQEYHQPIYHTICLMVENELFGTD